MSTTPISGMEQLSIVENVAILEQALASTSLVSQRVAPSTLTESVSIINLREAAERIERICNRKVNEPTFIMDEFYKVMEKFKPEDKLFNKAYIDYTRQFIVYSHVSANMNLSEAYFERMTKILKLWFEYRLNGFIKDEYAFAREILVFVKHYLKGSCRYCIVNLLLIVPRVLNIKVYKGCSRKRAINASKALFELCLNQKAEHPILMDDDSFIKHMMAFRAWRYIEMDNQRKEEIICIYLKSICPSRTLTVNERLAPLLPHYDETVCNDYRKLIEEHYCTDRIHEYIDKSLSTSQNVRFTNGRRRTLPNSSHVIDNSIIDLTDEPDVVEAVHENQIRDNSEYGSTRSESSIELEREFLSLAAVQPVSPVIISLDSDSDDEDTVKIPVSLKSSCSSKIVAEPVSCAPAIRTYVRPKTGGSSARTASESFVKASPIVYSAAPNIDLPLSTDSSTNSDDVAIQRPTSVSPPMSNVDYPERRPSYASGMEVDEDDDEVVGADENTAGCGSNQQISLKCSVPLTSVKVPGKQVRFAGLRERSKSVHINKQNIEKKRRQSVGDQVATPAENIFERFDYQGSAQQHPLQQLRTGTDDQISLSIGGCPELRSCSDDVIGNSGFISSSLSLLRQHSDRDNNLCKQIDCEVKSSETETRDDLEVTHTVAVMISDTSDGAAMDDNGLVEPIDAKSSINSIIPSTDELKSNSELSIVNKDSRMDGTSDYAEPQLTSIPVINKTTPALESIINTIPETSIYEHSAHVDVSINIEKIPPKTVLPNPEETETLIVNKNFEETPPVYDLSVHKNDLPEPELELTQEEEDALLNIDDDTDESHIDIECLFESETSHLGLHDIQSSSNSIEIPSIDLPAASLVAEAVCNEAASSIQNKHSVSSIDPNTQQDTNNEIDSEIYCNFPISLELPVKQEVTTQIAEETDTQTVEEGNTQAAEDPDTLLGFPVRTNLIEDALHSSEDLRTEGSPFHVDLINDDNESLSVNVEIVSIDSTVKKDFVCTKNNLNILERFLFDDYLPVHKDSIEIDNICSPECKTAVHRTALETLAEAALNSPCDITDITPSNILSDLNQEFYKPLDIIEQQMEKIHSSSPVEKIPAEYIPSTVNAALLNVGIVNESFSMAGSKIHRRRRRRPRNTDRHHYTVDRPAETIVRIKKVPLRPHHHRSHDKGHSKRRVGDVAAPIIISEPPSADRSHPNVQYSQPEAILVENVQPVKDRYLPSFSNMDYPQHMDSERYFDSGTPNQLQDLTSICATDDALPFINDQESDDIALGSLQEDLDVCAMDTYNSFLNNCQPTAYNNHRWYPSSNFPSTSISPNEAAITYSDYSEPNLHPTNEMANDFEEMVCQTNGLSTGEAVESEHSSKQSTLQLPIKKRVIPLPGTPVRSDPSYYDPPSMIYVQPSMVQPPWYNVSVVLHPYNMNAPQPPTTAVATSINYPGVPMLSIASLVDQGNFPIIQPTQGQRVMDRNCNFSGNQPNHVRCPGGGNSYIRPPHHHYDNPTTSIDSGVNQDSFMANSNSHPGLPPSHHHIHSHAYKVANTDQYSENFKPAFQAEPTTSSSSLGSNTNVNGIQMSPMQQQPSYQSATTPQRPPPPIPDTIQVTQTFHANNFRSAATQDMLSINLQDYSVSREQVLNLLNNNYLNAERGENSAMPSPTNCSSPTSRKRKVKHTSSTTNPQKRAKQETQSYEPQVVTAMPHMVRTKAARKVMSSGHNVRITRSSNRIGQDDNYCIESAEPSKKKGHSSKNNRK